VGSNPACEALSVENGNAIATRRRIVSSQELKVEALPLAEQKLSAGTVEQANGIAERVRDPKWFDRDPAKNAGPEWARVKAVKGTLSPDGRYAVAIAPTGN
jgi:hypothetical protein